MSIELPQWNSTLETSRVWSGTDADPYYLHAFNEKGRALCRSSIRARNHGYQAAIYRPFTWLLPMPLYRVHELCRIKAEAKVAEHLEAQQRAAEKAAFEAAQAEHARQERYGTAAEMFAEVHPAANRIVNAFQENAFTTAWEGREGFTSAEVWGQIGAEPGAMYGDDDGETNPTMPEALLKAWQYLDRLAASGELNERWDPARVDAARDEMAFAYERAPLTLDKTPESWQVLFHTETPLTGAQWADMPVHSVLRTEQLRAGHDWEVVEQRLAARGLSRYGFPDAVSAGHALSLARARWEEEGPHAAWFAFLDEDAELIESVRAQYNLTPEQERDAFERLSAAFTEEALPATTITFAEMRAIANGQEPTAQD